MTAQILMAIVGVVLSLLFSYVPGFANKYNPLDGTKKRLVMVGLLAATTLVVFGLSCTSQFAQFVRITCDEQGAIGLFVAFITALITNQSIDRISPQVGLKDPSRFSLIEDAGADRL